MILKFTGNHTCEIIIRDIIRIEIDTDVELFFHEEDYPLAIKQLLPKEINKFEATFSVLVEGEYVNDEVFIGYRINGKRYLFLTIVG